MKLLGFAWSIAPSLKHVPSVQGVIRSVSAVSVQCQCCVSAVSVQCQCSVNAVSVQCQCSVLVAAVTYMLSIVLLCDALMLLRGGYYEEKRR